MLASSDVLGARVINGVAVGWMGEVLTHSARKGVQGGEGKPRCVQPPFLSNSHARYCQALLLSGLSWRPRLVGGAGATPLQAPSMYLRPPRCYGDALRAIGDHVARARYVLSNIEAAVLVSPHSIADVRIPGCMLPALCGQPGHQGYCI